MGYTRLALYIAGLLLVVAAAWVFLTQTPFSDDIPAGVALAIILLLVGLGVMVSANAINDSTYRRRTVHDSDYAAAPPPVAARTTTYREGYRDAPPPSSGETIVEERRF